jgi:hypothetical protein
MRSDISQLELSSYWLGLQGQNRNSQEWSQMNHYVDIIDAVNKSRQEESAVALCGEPVKKVGLMWPLPEEMNRKSICPGCALIQVTLSYDCIAYGYEDDTHQRPE